MKNLIEIFFLFFNIFKIWKIMLWKRNKVKNNFNRKKKKIYKLEENIMLKLKELLESNMKFLN